MVYDSVDTYRLSKSALEAYLRTNFPGQSIEVTQLESEYRLRIPRPLAEGERNHIYNKVRYDDFGEVDSTNGAEEGTMAAPKLKKIKTNYLVQGGNPRGYEARKSADQLEHSEVSYDRKVQDIDVGGLNTSIRRAATVADSGYGTVSSSTKLAVVESSLPTTLKPIGEASKTADQREPTDVHHDRNTIDSDEMIDRYSYAGSLADYEDVATRVFAEWVLAVIHQQLREIKPMDVLAMLRNILPEFAIKLGHEGKSSVHWKLMFVAHKRAAYKAVAELMGTHIASSGSVHSGSANDGDGEEKPPDDVGWRDRVDQWDYQPVVEPPPEWELPNTVTADPYEDYRQILHTAEASSWLVSALKRGLELRGVDPVSAQRVRRQVLDTLTTPSAHGLASSSRRISSRRNPPSYRTFFQAWWDPVAFLEEEYPGLDSPDLATVVTVTGDGEILQALPCKDYMMQVWPFTTPDILSLLTALISQPKVLHETTLKGNSQIGMYLENGILQVNIQGTEFQVAEIAEMVAWLGCALQPRRDMAFCHIQPRLEKMSTLGTLDRDLTGIIHFSLRFIALPQERVETADCWKQFFTYMPIAQGFPIPARPPNTPGLEIPLDIAARIIDAETIVPFKSRLLIKGFSRMLYPARINIEDNTISWHLLETNDESRISYADPRVGHGSYADVKRLRYYDVERARHIVGWCENVKNVTGTADAKYDIGPCGLDPPRPGWVLEKLQIAGGQYITPTFIFSPGKRIRALKIERDGKDIISRLEWLDNKSVILFDTRHRRGWLVDGPSAVLHLTRASLELDNGRYIRKKYADITLEVPMIEEDDERDYSHRAICLEILTDDDNLDKPLRNKRRIRGQTLAEVVDNKYTFEDRVKEILCILEQMFDHQADMQGDGVGFCISTSNWDQLQGFDFVDIAGRSYPFGAKGYELREDGKGWVQFTRAIHAITLFGYDFGHLLEPVSNANGRGPCDRCFWNSSVPKDRDILAVSMDQLEWLHRGRPKWGTCEPGTRQIVQNHVWERPASAFDHCACDPTARKQLVQARVQTFGEPLTLLSRFTRRPEPDSGTVSRTGAVLLGVHRTILQKTRQSPSINAPQVRRTSQASASSGSDIGSTSRSSQRSSSASGRHPSSATSLGTAYQSRSPSSYGTQPSLPSGAVEGHRHRVPGNAQGESSSHGAYLAPADLHSRKRRALDGPARPDAESSSRPRPVPVTRHGFQSRLDTARTLPEWTATGSDVVMRDATANHAAGLRRRDGNWNLAEGYNQADEGEEDEDEY